jgi:inositol-phosphate transport system substrate-binding protein
VYYAFGGTTIDADTGNLVYDTAAGLKFYEFFERGLTGDGAHSFLTGDWDGSYHPNVSGGNVLFWAGGTWQWAEWAQKWTGPENLNLGGESYQFENWGYGLYPTGLAGGSPTTLSHPLSYLNSAHLGILTTQASYEPYTADVFLTSVTYMVDFANYLPNNPNWGTQKQATFDALAAVQDGTFTAQEAVDFVVETLQNQLGDEVIIK